MRLKSPLKYFTLFEDTWTTLMKIFRNFPSQMAAVGSRLNQMEAANDELNKANTFSVSFYHFISKTQLKGQCVFQRA